MAGDSPFGPLIGARQAKNVINKAVRDSQHVPIIGPWIGRASRIEQILSLPCTPTPEMWIRAAFHGIGYAIYHGFKPSPTDFLAQRFGSGESHRTGGKTSKPKFKIDAQGFEFLPKLDVGDGAGWAALRGVQLIRMVGFYITIVDVATEGLAISSSLAYALAGCSTADTVYAQAHALVPDAIIFNGPWLPYTGWIWDSQHGNNSGGASGITANANKAFMISWALSAKKPDIPDYPETTYEFRLRDSNDQIYSGDRHTVSVQGQTTSGVALFDRGNPAPVGMNVEYRISGGGGAGLITGGHMTYTEYWKAMDAHL